MTPVQERSRSAAAGTARSGKNEWPGSEGSHHEVRPGDVNLGDYVTLEDVMGEGRQLYGARGWSVRAGVWEVIARCRDEMRSVSIPASLGIAPTGVIRGGVPVDDFTPFHDMGPDGARRLRRILPAEQLLDRHNLAPSLGCALEACLEAEGRVRLSGYGIGPQRADERVSVEGMWLADTDLLEFHLSPVHHAGCQCEELWKRVQRRYSLDALGRPSEVRFERQCWDRGPLGTWLWWD